MKISFIVTLLTLGCASAATRGLKGVASGGEGKSAETRALKGKGGSKCFETDHDAAAIGNTILADFWADAHKTGCEPAGIAKALSEVFAEDVTVSIGGNLIVDSIDGAIELLVGTEDIAGSLTDLCLNHYVSWYAARAEVMSPDDNTFVLYANELTTSS
jgi:hypothetical protein